MKLCKLSVIWKRFEEAGEIVGQP